jgi:hypothetical protein
MAYSPKTYEDWLALSEQQRKEVHFKEWNVYQRDGIAIAFMAATRLALQCNKRVLEIQIGTYHMGEYLLHLTVSEQDYRGCPPMLTDSFEGFRVVWLPPRMFEPTAEVPGTLEGKWRAEDGDYEFELWWTNSGVDVIARVLGTGEEMQIDRPIVNGKYVLFSAYDPTRDDWTHHTLSLVDRDRCEDRATRTDYYRRVPG